jgi:hypothetical protein
MIPLFLFFSAGCGDASRTRAGMSGENSGEVRTAKATVDKASPAKSAESAEKNGAPTTNESQAPSTSERSKEVAGEKESQVAAPRRSGGGIREITFDNIKFDIDKGEPFERKMLTDGIEKLDGQRVRIRGYMLPSFQQSGIKQFVLVRDNMECCFGPGAALYDCIIVEMQGEKTCDFSVRPIAVEGAFTVREFKGPDDTHLAIYHLAGERVR